MLCDRRLLLKSPTNALSPQYLWLPIWRTTHSSGNNFLSLTVPNWPIQKTGGAPARIATRAYSHEKKQTGKCSLVPDAVMCDGWYDVQRRMASTTTQGEAAVSLNCAFHHRNTDNGYNVCVDRRVALHNRTKEAHGSQHEMTLLRGIIMRHENLYCLLMCGQFLEL